MKCLLSAVYYIQLYGYKGRKREKKSNLLLLVKKLIIHDAVAVCTPEVKRIERTIASYFTDTGLQYRSPYCIGRLEEKTHTHVHIPTNLLKILNILNLVT